MDSCLDDPVLLDIAKSAGRSNTEILSPAANDAVKAALPRIQVALKAIEDEIARLTSQKRQLNALTCSLKIAQAPHKRLPEEIITYVFSFLTKPGGIRIRDDISMNHDAWPVRSVCWSWRNLVLAESSLWNSVVLIPPPINWALTRTADIGEWLSQISRAQHILTKEGGVSISIRLDRGQNLLADFAMERLIYPLAERIQCLQLTGGLRAFVDFFNMPNHCIAQFPKLKTLKIGFVDADSTTFGVGEAGEGNKSFFDLVPTLTSLTIEWNRDQDFDDLFISLLKDNIPWTQLTQFNLTVLSVDIRQIIPVIRLAQNLRKLVLFIRSTPEISLENEAFEMLHLQELHIQLRTTHMVHFMDHLVLPNLLHLWVVDFDGKLGLEAISGMIHRCRGSLLSFSERVRGITRDGPHLGLLSDLEGVANYRTNRVVNPEFLTQLAAREILPGCHNQAWVLNTTIRPSRGLAAVHDGLMRYHGAPVEGTNCVNRTLFLDGGKYYAGEDICSEDKIQIAGMEKDYGFRLVFGTPP